jgi:K+-sensing histidine kinase KdpD
VTPVRFPTPERGPACRRFVSASPRGKVVPGGKQPETLAQVFEPFTQAGRTLDRSEGGLGIGLTLARRLVELHGGSITAPSEGPGRGSEFVVRLPLVPPPPGTPPAG